MSDIVEILTDLAHEIDKPVVLAAATTIKHLRARVAELERQRDAFMESSAAHYTAWTSAKQAIVEAINERELYKARWLECVTPEESARAQASAVKAALERAHAVAVKWSSANQFKLHAGEMTAAETRSVLAVTGACARDARSPRHTGATATLARLGSRRSGRWR